MGPIYTRIIYQAGQYQFHPYCAACTRCGQNFADGEEMFMQGDEIWHARCNDIKDTAAVVHVSAASTNP